MASTTDLTSTNTIKNKSSVSEKGHARTLADGQLLINYASQLGGEYNPSNSKILISNLQNLLSNSQSIHQNALNLVPAYSLAVTNREQIFAPKNKKAPLLKKALKATENVTPAMLDDFATLTRKYAGQRKKAINPNSEDTNTHSVAQLSYDQKTNNYHQLAVFLQNVPNYNPNEVAYKVVTLLVEKNEMLAATQQVSNSYIPLTAARAERNNVMYLNPDGMVEIFAIAKNYILSVVPKTSPIYKAVVKLKFSKNY